MQKLPLAEFGRALITTGDLDPVYLAVRRANLSYPQRTKFCLAYWCLYALGPAAFLSELRDELFWEGLTLAAENDEEKCGFRWPRGAERRHWRGAQALASVEDLKARAETLDPNVRSVSNFVTTLVGVGNSLEHVLDSVKTLRGFGDWIAFKVADMSEAVLDKRIPFPLECLAFYDEPRRGAALHLGIAENEMKPEQLRKVVEELLFEYRFLQAPHADRPVGVQEVETVLCKWKSYMNGHYYIGKDIHEYRAALTGSPWGPTADKLLAGLPPEVEQ